MFHLLSAFSTTPWALDRATLDLMGGVLLRWTMGERLSPDEIRAAVGQAPEVAAKRKEDARAASAGGVQVIPIYGVLAHRQHQVENTSRPLTSAESLARIIRAAGDDPEVGHIVLDVDSPGGSAFGVQELGDVVHQVAQQKPVTAVANSIAASGAYWVASQATELVVTPSGWVGSIGVITSHIDASAAYEKLGVKKEFITAGKYKAEGNDTGPLDDDARAEVQATVDKFYAAFVKAVARGRKVSVADVRGPAFGEGRMRLARDAVDTGMADRIDTLDNVIAQLTKARRRPATMSAGLAGARVAVLQAQGTHLGDIAG